MSTKNDKHLFIEQSFTTSENQYYNLNLNQCKKCPILVPVQSYSKSNNNDKYCVSENYEEKEKLQLWNKSSKASAFTTHNDDNYDLQKRWKNENTLKIFNNSTISLNIAAYENSTEAVASDLFDNENIEGLKKEKLESLKTQCFTDNLISRNPFEFPRQQQGAGTKMSRSTKQAAPDVKTMNAELFTLTYGALVVDLLRDLESEEEVNIQLEKIGYNIGVRIADDLLSKNPNIGRCTDTHQIAEVISKQALKAYLGVTAHVSQSNMPANEFSLILDSNPLVEFVEIPAKYSKLSYSQVICGAIHGALEALHLKVNASLVKDVPDPTEIHVKFIRVLHEYMPTGDED